MTDERHNLPQILDATSLGTFPVLVEDERQLLSKAAELHALGFCDYALLGIWNAAVGNLKRRVEAYGVDLWISVVQEEPGRKKYDKDGDTLAARWEGVDDLVLVFGATSLGILNRKAGKALEMINWMRNHASAAHDSDHKVDQTDVIALAILLQRNLFEVPLPDPGHSVSTLFDPVKKAALLAEDITMLEDEIRALRTQDIRICFGFMLDMLLSEEEPGLTNATQLFPAVWDKASDDLRKAAGIKYHTLKFEADPSMATQNRAARNHLLNMLVQVKGVKYIPEAARAQLYRRAARKLAEAKNAPYGWTEEVSASKTLVQLGPYVPSVAFEDVYQEIFAVWSGNYWGRSSSYTLLKDFVEILNVDQIRVVSRMFMVNERVRDELGQTKPKEKALELLGVLEKRLTIEANKEEIRKAIKSVSAL